MIVKIEKPVNKGVAIYARVSSSENKSNLDTQAERLEKYCLAKGYQVVRIVKEVAGASLGWILHPADNTHLVA